jgi:hypothetical protein
VCALVLGRREFYAEHAGGDFPPSNLPLALTGAGLLFCGWFGFNAGSALASGSLATSAVVSTQAGSTSAHACVHACVRGREGGREEESERGREGGREGERERGAPTQPALTQPALRSRLTPVWDGWVATDRWLCVGHGMAAAVCQALVIIWALSGTHRPQQPTTAMASRIDMTD